MKKMLLLLFVAALSLILIPQTFAVGVEDDYLVKNPISEWDGFDIDIYKSKLTDAFYTDLDSSDYMWTGDGKTYYVAPTSGSDVNDGLTRETAFSTLDKAISKGDADIIRIIEDGWFDYNDGFDNGTLEQNLSIIADETVDITIATTESVTFSKTDTYTNVYDADMTLLLSVADLTYSLNGGLYEKVNSITEVDSTAGSYYYASDKIYVHTFDNRVPDDDIKTFKDVKNLFVNGYYHIYLENLNIYGGNSYYTTFITSIYDADNQSTFIAKDCNFKYSLEGTSSGIKLSNTKSILQNVTVSYTNGDAIAYEDHSYAIEDEVIAHHAGIIATDSERNASTAHGGTKVIRINGEYFNTEGPVIHDIENGTQSWNIQTNAHDSDADNIARVTSYRIEQNAEMFLYKTEGNSTSYDLYATTNGKIYEYRATYDTEDTLETLDGVIYSLVMVDFESNGGNKIASETVVYGQYLSLPESPNQDGYTFTGWYKEATIQNLFDFDETRILEDIILYAAYVNGNPDNNESAGTVTAPIETTELFGVDWYWWALGASIILYLSFTKKGRKMIGLKSKRRRR